MEKLIYLLWAPSGQSLDDHRDELLARCAPRLLELGARGLAINADDSDADVPPSSRGMTGRPPFTAQVSVWLDDHGQGGALEQVLREHCAQLAGYLVTESLYTEYGGNRHSRPRDWEEGARSPGVLTVTLLEKPLRHSYEPWLSHWYGTQSPVSEAMQPRTRYVRNAVVSAVTPSAPLYHGIVEEAWPSARHMTDPYLFYGAASFGSLVENMGSMMRSVTGFLDLPRIQNVTMSEYLLRPPERVGVL